jgi:dUTP pyrophosphatase
MNFFNFFKKKKDDKTLWVKLKKIDDRAVVPSYAHNGDVCMDMTAIDVEYVLDGDFYIYHTGLAFESNFNVGQFLFARSSNCKTEAYLPNGVGVADSAIYRGEIQFRYKKRDSLKNVAEGLYTQCFAETFVDKIGAWDGNKKNWKKSYDEAKKAAYDKAMAALKQVVEDEKKLEYAPYKVGDRVGQMMFIGIPNVKIEVVDELSDTERGSGGFGSTGR